jgi:hypothetical protein
VSEQYWIENLGYTVESFNSETSSRLEILARCTTSTRHDRLATLAGPST